MSPSHSFSQVTFYKYLFHGYESGRNSSLDGGVVTENDSFALIESIWGHGISSTRISYFDVNGNKTNVLPTRDTSQIPIHLPYYSSLKPLKTETGYLETHLYGFKDSILKTSIIYYDFGRNTKWIKTLNSTPFLAQGNSNGEIITLSAKDTITIFNASGNLKAQITIGNRLKINPLLNRNKKVGIGISDSGFYYWETNQTDSFQLLKYNHNGVLNLDTLIIGSKILDFKVFHDNLITIEDNARLEVVFRNAMLTKANSYSFSNEFPLTYDRTIFKDSLISIIVYNNVDAAIYGTADIPEVRVINWKGKYLRRRYFRYNGGHNGVSPNNAIGIVIRGIDYTLDNGYYMSLELEKGTLDRQFGLLKTDRNLLANDTIFVPAIRLFLNQWDTVLTPLKQDSISSMQSRMHHQFAVGPNPTSSAISIIQYSNARFEYALFSLNGTEIKSGIGSTKTTVDVSDVPNGVYVLQIRMKGLLDKRKIVIQR